MNHTKMPVVYRHFSMVHEKGYTIMYPVFT